MIYSTILHLRDFLYKRNIKKSVKASVPTICVGNITVGGTGKTPMTELIIRELLRSGRWGDGHAIAMLSRGYKRKSRGYKEVRVDSNASFAGDEPLQVKRKFPAVTVAVDKNRVEGCRILAEKSSEIVVLDDAFQYRRLSADLNVVLVNYNRPVNKDHLIPFGHLRDLKVRLRDADIIVVTKCPPFLEEGERRDFALTLGLKEYDTESFTGTYPEGGSQLVLFSTVCYGKGVPMFADSDPRFMYSKKLVMFSGIADDVQFRRHLSDGYKIMNRLSFPDHHRYRRSDFRKILSCVKANPTAVVVTTEKDAQRVRDCRRVPSTLSERMFYVPIETCFLTEEEAGLFRNHLLCL